MRSSFAEQLCSVIAEFQAVVRNDVEGDIRNFIAVESLYREKERNMVL